MTDSGKQVDAGWKERARQEKQRLSEELEQGGGPGGIPPADFETHVSAIATQALVSLGQMPHPLTGQPALDVEVARFHIDTLNMLQAKTKGNLDAQETALMEQILYSLRMLFVQVGGGSPPPGPTAAKDDEAAAGGSGSGSGSGIIITP